MFEGQSGTNAPAGTRETASTQQGFGQGIMRFFCAVIAYFASLFAFTWGVSSLASLMQGTGREFFAGLVGLFFAAIAALIAFICLRKTLGFGPLMQRSNSAVESFTNAMQFTERHEIRVSRASALRRLAMGAGLIVISPLLLISFSAKGIIYAAFLFFGGVLIAAASVRALLNGNLAFFYDLQGVSIPGLLGTKRFEWREVEDIQVMRRALYLYHIVPIRNIYHVYLKTRGGLFGTRKVYLPLSLTGYKKEDMAALALKMHQQRSYSLGAPQIMPLEMNAPQPAPNVPAGSRSTPMGSFGKRRR